MGVSKNNGTPKSSILYNRVFHYFHHPFWGTPIFGNTHIVNMFVKVTHFMATLYNDLDSTD